VGTSGLVPGAAGGFHIRHRHVPPPADAPVLFDGCFPDGLPCVLRQVGETEHYAIDGRASLVIGERQAWLTLPDGDRVLKHGSVAFRAISAALALCDQYFLHAAALVLPRSDAAILIFGPSGHGKTTTTLSLLPAGFGLLTDDATVLKRGAGGRDLVWGLPVPLKVHENSVRLLPWLSPLATGRATARREYAVTPDMLSSAFGVAGGNRTLHALRAIIVLGERSPRGHEMRHMTKSDALIAVASDNVSRDLHGISAPQRMRMKRITELLSAVDTYEFRAGPDLQSLPAVLLDGLDGKHAASRSHAERHRPAEFARARRRASAPPGN
jgi:hypothetical protein